MFERVDAAFADAQIASIVNWAPINTGQPGPAEPRRGGAGDSVAPTILDHLGIGFDRGGFESGSVLEGGGDPLPPVVADFLTPTDEAQFVPVGTDLVIEFSEAIQLGTGTIAVREAAGGMLVQSVDVASANVAVDGSTLTVDLPEDLARGRATT
ncbi:Ig-like domain-containing protein [Acuticoccus sp.]|uniref:Ig-like domain-containing protein n=1 Tax=Acuticoccus sp. TaxID=1904378 RepID=UPI003B51F936